MRAEFLADTNIPDGSKCLANKKFQKIWLIKNTGKLAWSDKFPVNLVCIGGNIRSVDEKESVRVRNTTPGESTNVAVNLIAPNAPGEWFTEWALVCRNGYQFGPRLWCSIIVGTGEEQQMDKSNFVEKSVSDDEADEFVVVVPDCFDLSKKWAPQKTLSHNMNDLESSYFEVKHEEEKPNITQGQSEEQDLIQLNSNQDLLTIEANKAEDVELDSYDTDSVDIKPVVNEVAHEDLNASKFSLIKESFANLKGPSNVIKLAKNFILFIRFYSDFFYKDRRYRRHS